MYAANDAKITFELFKWQLPYITKSHKKCIDNHLERIADLVWDIEFPLIKVCSNLHRLGMYVDKETCKVLMERYHKQLKLATDDLKSMVQDIIDEKGHTVPSSVKKPFLSGSDFNPKSPLHVKYLLYTLLKLPIPKDGKQGTGKEILNDINLPVTNQILKVRSLNVLIDTFVDKLPKSTTSDSRIHALFRSTGAATGRFSSAEPNLMNIPSRSVDIRHMFRATASQIVTEEVEVQDDFQEFEMTLPSLNRVETRRGEVNVKNLVVGDEVRFYDEKEELYLYVKSIETSDENTCICYAFI